MLGCDFSLPFCWFGSIMISGVVLVGFRCVYCCLCGCADWLCLLRYWCGGYAVDLVAARLVFLVGWF